MKWKSVSTSAEIISCCSQRNVHFKLQKWDGTIRLFDVRWYFDYNVAWLETNVAGIVTPEALWFAFTKGIFQLRNAVDLGDCETSTQGTYAKTHKVRASTYKLRQAVTFSKLGRNSSECAEKLKTSLQVGEHENVVFS